MSKKIPPIVSVEDVVRLREQREDVRLLDVRTPGEFARGHIAGAYNVPLGRLQAHATTLREVGSAPVVLVCRSGARARSADALLRAAGLRSLHVLEGGMIAWQRAGRPVLRTPSRLTAGRVLQVVAGIAAVVSGLLLSRTNTVAGLLFVFLGVRFGIVGGGLGCAGGACAVPAAPGARTREPAEVARAFADGTPLEEPPAAGVAGSAA